ncbi:MAG: hypothetical protein COY53_00870 [Elusimicrobia bacterium CG_4_10_14_0_8_um_filter_37_32]|nr:MAG: hypothetical protein COS17_06455 [Elusimicrobia bacterium CG02_land_8_20_14_3_00_37_13]PIZ14200.1 MAG: hypothetical protein COY53_00870 [Elusimicrobia bacterium CG_4_10_14_0_8_um_filter_37_32]
MMKDKNMVVKKEQKSDIDKKGYNTLLNDVKSILEKAKYQTYKAVDNLRVQTYWQVGERIVREELIHKDRADYGKRIAERLANDLSVTRALLFEIIQFYRAYPIVHTLRGQLSWSHYGSLIRIQGKVVREFYEGQTIQNNWRFILPLADLKIKYSLLNIEKNFLPKKR